MAPNPTVCMASVPVRKFWSVTIYDNLTRSLTMNRANRAAITSYDNIKLNEDGSADLYFGPIAPASLESNWVDTSASQGWFAWFRFYARHNRSSTRVGNCRTSSSSKGQTQRPNAESVCFFEITQLHSIRSVSPIRPIFT